MNSSYVNRCQNNYRKKYHILNTLRRACGFLSSSIEVGDTGAIEAYTRIIRENTRHLYSIEPIIASCNPMLSPESAAAAWKEDFERQFKVFYEEITVLHRENMDALGGFVAGIRKQLSSVQLLTRGRLLYNGSSLPEYIDIKR